MAVLCGVLYSGVPRCCCKVCCKVVSHSGVARYCRVVSYGGVVWCVGWCCIVVLCYT